MEATIIDVGTLAVIVLVVVSSCCLGIIIGKCIWSALIGRYPRYMYCARCNDMIGVKGHTTPPYIIQDANLIRRSQKELPDIQVVSSEPKGGLDESVFSRLGIRASEPKFPIKAQQLESRAFSPVQTSPPSTGDLISSDVEILSPPPTQCKKQQVSKSSQCSSLFMPCRTLKTSQIVITDQDQVYHGDDEKYLRVLENSIAGQSHLQYEDDKNNQVRVLRSPAGPKSSNLPVSKTPGNASGKRPIRPSGSVKSRRSLLEKGFVPLRDSTRNSLRVVLTHDSEQEATDIESRTPLLRPEHINGQALQNAGCSRQRGAPGNTTPVDGLQKMVLSAGKDIDIETGTQSAARMSMDHCAIQNTRHLSLKKVRRSASVRTHTSQYVLNRPGYVESDFTSQSEDERAKPPLKIGAIWPTEENEEIVYQSATSLHAPKVSTGRNGDSQLGVSILDRSNDENLNLPVPGCFSTRKDGVISQHNSGKDLKELSCLSFGTNKGDHFYDHAELGLEISANIELEIPNLSPEKSEVSSHNPCSTDQSRINSVSPQILSRGITPQPIDQATLATTTQQPAYHIPPNNDSISHTLHIEGNTYSQSLLQDNPTGPHTLGNTVGQSKDLSFPPEGAAASIAGQMSPYASQQQSRASSSSGCQWKGEVDIVHPSSHQKYIQSHLRSLSCSKNSVYENETGPTELAPTTKDIPPGFAPRKFLNPSLSCPRRSTSKDRKSSLPPKPTTEPRSRSNSANRFCQSLQHKDVLSGSTLDKPCSQYQPSQDQLYNQPLQEQLHNEPQFFQDNHIVEAPYSQVCQHKRLNSERNSPVFNFELTERGDTGYKQLEYHRPLNNKRPTEKSRPTEGVTKELQPVTDSHSGEHGWPREQTDTGPLSSFRPRAGTESSRPDSEIGRERTGTDSSSQFRSRKGTESSQARSMDWDPYMSDPVFVKQQPGPDADYPVKTPESESDCWSIDTDSELGRPRSLFSDNGPDLKMEEAAVASQEEGTWGRQLQAPFVVPASTEHQSEFIRRKQMFEQISQQQEQRSGYQRVHREVLTQMLDPQSPSHHALNQHDKSPHDAENQTVKVPHDMNQLYKTPHDAENQHDKAPHHDQHPHDKAPHNALNQHDKAPHHARNQHDQALHHTLKQQDKADHHAQKQRRYTQQIDYSQQHHDIQHHSPRPLVRHAPEPEYHHQGSPHRLPRSGKTDVQLPLEHAIGQSPLDHAIGQPPLKYAVGQPPLQHDVDQPPLKHAVGQPPLQHAVGQPLVKDRVFSYTRSSSSASTVRAGSIDSPEQDRTMTEVNELETNSDEQEHSPFLSHVL